MTPPRVSSVPPSSASHDRAMRLVASTASAFCAATAATTPSRVSVSPGGITSQLTMATVSALLILDASARSNLQRWLKSGLMPTTKTRENDWSRETPSDHALETAAWLGAAENHAAPRTKRVGRTDGRVARGRAAALVGTDTLLAAKAFECTRLPSA